MRFLSLVLLVLIAYWPGEREPLEISAIETREDLPWSYLESSWQIKVVEEIRRDYLVSKTGIDKELALQIVRKVHEECLSHDLDANRVLAIVVVESYANPQAVSHAGAIGLMQVMPDTGHFISNQTGYAYHGARSLKDVETNIAFGTWYYNYLLRRFRGDPHTALAAYNWGPEEIDRRHRRGTKIPQVYPGKVRVIREELDEVLWNEYETRFWRGLDRFVRDSRECYRARRSTVICGLELHTVVDGKSLLPRSGQGSI